MGVHVGICLLNLSDFYYGPQDGCVRPELLDKIRKCPQQYVQIYHVSLLIRAVAGSFKEPLIV
jgi:hypothetical protein